ncbi:Cytochrome P450 [Amycolatopsis xylanica]|uniref:Cytochrome P450 n=1 Tax=Amycolatopsis xylanica TaxID=589385 RepID=A0A1H3TA17_9PSEU|nr:cytochrome P450 [Amycolatopsis xylanica]SDZ47086.1 Cytochrome P450 [Amycolatopsis xylanica]
MSSTEVIFEFHERTAADGLREPVRFTHGAWFVHSHAEVDRVLTEHATFSSDELRHSAEPVPHADNPLLRTMLALDPPEHHRQRKIVSRAFTPRAVAALKPRIAATARELLDATKGSSIDFIDGFAYPLPIITIAALLGVDPGRQPDFVRWAEAVTSFAGSFALDPSRRAEFEKAYDELATYFRELAEARRAAPRDDVISTLAAADGLTDEELADFCALLLINGHETTKTLLVNALLCLDRYPWLRAAPVAGVVEEVLRFLPPSGGTDRFTTTATTLGGHEIGAGERVVAMIISANRDPAVFADPHRFDTRRAAGAHLSFGHGIHFCLGAHLARWQAEIALSVLVERLPGRWRLPEESAGIRTTPVGVDVTALRLDWAC